MSSVLRVAVMLSLSAVSLQQPAPLRSGVTLIEVDVVVRTKSGEFVRGLERHDFVVRENGRPQDVAVLRLVDIPRDNPTARNASGSEDETVARASSSRDRRLYLIVLDVMHVDPTRTTVLRRRVKEFIGQYLGPSDLAAVAQLGYPAASLEFTPDTSLLLAAVDRAIGEKTGSEAVAVANADPEMLAAGANADPEARVRRHMAERAMFELTALAQALGEQKTPRKAIVLFSEGLDVDMGNPAHADLFEQVRDLYAAAARANVTIYTVDPRGVSSVADDLMQVRGTRSGADPATRALYRELQVAQQSLRNLADQTGGLAWVGSGDFARGFRQIVEDNSTYCLLGYYSNDQRQDGKYRALSVRVNRPGVSVRARKGYYVPRS